MGATLPFGNSSLKHVGILPFLQKSCCIYRRNPQIIQILLPFRANNFSPRPSLKQDFRLAKGQYDPTGCSAISVRLFATARCESDFESKVISVFSSALPWNGILNCTRPTNYPMQNVHDSSEMRHFTPFAGSLSSASNNMSEDCLRLSVYTPRNFSNGKHPVSGLYVCITL